MGGLGDGQSAHAARIGRKLYDKLYERRLNPAFIFNSAWEAQRGGVRRTRVEPFASKGTAMIKKYVAMGVGALIALAPVAAMATTSTSKAHKSTHHSSHHHTAKKAAPEAPKS
jgi:hypothetical protein